MWVFFIILFFLFAALNCVRDYAPCHDYHSAWRRCLRAACVTHTSIHQSAVLRGDTSAEQRAAQVDDKTEFGLICWYWELSSVLLGLQG